MIALALLLGACAAKEPAGRGSVPDWVARMPVAPLVVEQVRVSAAEGGRAVLLKLSRFPEGIEHVAEDDPARIGLALAGPVAGEDLPEERIVPSDAVVNAVRVSRRAGTVHVVIELAGDEAPPYTVHEMADWLMIRLR